MESTECAAVGEGFTDAYYRDDFPGSMMMPMFECDIGDAKCCGPTVPIPSTDTTCNQGNVGSLAVDVRSAEDVKIAVAWARDHGVALSVKSTGHDFQGRSMNKDTLNIWIHNLKGVTYMEDW